jgi:glycosyltransferase involved in cell wall biosynthesis
MDVDTVHEPASSLPRIAVVAASLDILGGQGVQASVLGRALQAEGAEVRFIPVNPRFPRGLGWLRRWPFVRTALNQVLYALHLAGLRRADVAHVFSASYWSFLLGPAPAMLLARALGKRVVLHYHSGEAEDHLARWGALVHPWLRLADEIVVPSEFLREVFQRHGYRPRVIRNVLDLSRFSFRERLPLRPRLLSARNLEPHYRVDDTLRAFALVRARHPGATLTVAGYGSREGELRRLAAWLGTAGIRFAGRQEPEGMRRLLEESDIFLNASVVDNQPVSILEAFASGLPVVSTPTGDIRAMVRQDETGLLVPPRDPAAMAAAVLRLLADPALARRLARSARLEASEYAWPRVRRAWQAVYQGGAA